MATFIYPAQQVSISGAATEAKQDVIITELQDVNTELDSQSTSLTDIEAALSLDVVDQIDSTPVLDTSLTNIPASASLPVEVVASTAARIRKVISVDDIGEYIGLYEGPASSETLVCVLPLGGGAVEIDVPAATRLSLRNMQNATISSGLIALNLLG